MSWVRLDDRFSEHPKVLSAGPLGLAVHVRALCYAARNLTDGFIPSAVIPTLTADVALVSRAAGATDWPGVLVSAGLWERATGGFQIHDFLEFNPSKEKQQAERRATAERVTRYRERHNAPSNGACNAVTSTPVTGEVTPPPYPGPVPVPVEEKREGAKAPREPRKRFTPPTVEEVAAYLLEIGARFSASRFVDHHIGNGWTWGKAHHPVKDWKAVARTWKERDEERGVLLAAPIDPKNRTALIGSHGPAPVRERTDNPPAWRLEVARRLRTREDVSDVAFLAAEAWERGENPPEPPLDPEECDA